MRHNGGTKTFWGGVAAGVLMVSAGCAGPKCAAVCPSPPAGATAADTAARPVQTIVVLPFKMPIDSPYSGWELSRMLGEELRKTGRFRVVDLHDVPLWPLAAALEERNLDRLAGNPLAEYVRQRAGVQGFVAGRVEFFSSRTKDKPFYGYAGEAHVRCLPRWFWDTEVREFSAVRMCAGIVPLSGPAPANKECAVGSSAYTEIYVQRPPLGVYGEAVNEAMREMARKLSRSPEAGAGIAAAASRP